MNAQKSQVVLFSKCLKETPNKDSLNLKLFNEKIPVQDEAVYLGITFDRRLSWEQQITKMASKAYGRLNLMRAVSGLSSKPNPSLLSKLYNATIRTIFEYASICIVSAAEVHLGKLEVIHNEALRIILKLPAYIPVKIMNDCAGQIPIKTHLIRFAKERISCLRQSSPLVRKSIEDYSQIRINQYNFSPLDALKLHV